MKRFADLHIHTSCSDGSDSAAEVLALAQENQVSWLSVTDHNTLDAYRGNIRDQAQRLGVHVIPGVELDVIHKGKQYHLLGYGIDTHHEELLHVCGQNVRAQEEYNLSLLQYMEKDGLGVSEKAYHGYEIPRGRGGWKLLNYLLDAGVTGTLLEGTKYYKQYGFDSNRIAFVPLAEAVRVVKAASGVPVLAHPAEQIPYEAYAASQDSFWSRLDDVLATGIEGVECVHPLHGFGLQRELISLCRARGLFVSGGTDYHGNFFHKQKQTIGGQLVGVEIVEKLLEACGENKAGHPAEYTA